MVSECAVWSNDIKDTLYSLCKCKVTGRTQRIVHVFCALKLNEKKDFLFFISIVEPCEMPDSIVEILSNNCTAYLIFITKTAANIVFGIKTVE